MDKIIEYTSRSRLRRSTVIAPTAYRSRVCDNVVKDGQWRDLYLPVYSGFPNCDDRRPNCDAFFNGVLLHGYHAQLGLNFSSKIQKRKVHQCCKSASVPTFGRAVPIQEFRSGSKRCPRDLNGADSFPRLSAESQAHRGKAGLSVWLQVGGATFVSPRL